jgi:hypothetical protein
MNADDVARSFARHRRAQLRRNLRLSYAERLRWLEETMETFRKWQGLARTAAAKRNRPA